MAKKIWIVYKTESMSAPGWEERQLMPRGSLTNISSGLSQQPTLEPAT
ncbi:hypothetical protein QUA82_30170 [Microcoleus sp. F8-D3]